MQVIHHLKHNKTYNPPFYSPNLLIIAFISKNITIALHHHSIPDSPMKVEIAPATTNTANILMNKIAKMNKMNVIMPQVSKSIILTFPP